MVPLNDLTVLEQQNISLEVQVSKPGAHLVWFKDGTEISPSERIDINVEGTIHKLYIKQAILNDEGEYVVTVGLAVSKGMVHVKGGFGNIILFSDSHVFPRFRIVQSKVLSYVSLLYIM